jgi:predicted oxidoreductase
VSAFDYANLPCWMVFDQGFIERYGFPITGGKPGVAPPQWVPSAATLAGLAERLAIPAYALEATVKRWNAQVAAGRDDDFHRGEAAHDQWWGDAALRGGVQASLGPIDRGPFYAVEIKSGALGTKGGPKTNVNANVLNVDGEPIVGLYAAGNVMSSPMGMTYGGAGGTIAPGMVFGYLAGRHAAGNPLFADEAAR